MALLVMFLAQRSTFGVESIIVQTAEHSNDDVCSSYLSQQVTNLSDFTLYAERTVERDR
jgi:hypothetical protein